MTDSELSDIFDKHVSYWRNGDIEASEEQIISAMKEAMRIESIGFANWLANNGYKGFGASQWFGDFDKLYYTKDLYTFYLKSSEK